MSLEASGRLKKGIMRTQRITIRIEEEKYKTLKEEAERLGIKITALIKHLTYRYISELKQSQIADK